MEINLLEYQDETYVCVGCLKIDETGKYKFERFEEPMLKEREQADEVWF